MSCRRIIKVWRTEADMKEAPQAAKCLLSKPLTYLKPVLPDWREDSSFWQGWGKGRCLCFILWSQQSPQRRLRKFPVT